MVVMARLKQSIPFKCIKIRENKMYFLNNNLKEKVYEKKKNEKKRKKGDDQTKSKKNV